MVSRLIHGGNLSHFGNPCCSFHFTVLWARVRMGHVCPSFMRKSMIALCCIWFVFAMHLMDRIDVIASCMIFREPMHLHKPLLYRNCASMSSHVHYGTHGRVCIVYKMDSWGRDATSSSIIAYLIPGLHLHFYFSIPLPDIVLICSPLDNLHVLMDTSVSVLNSFLDLNWWTTY